MDGFSGILDIGKEEEVKMILDKRIGGKNVSGFVGTLKKLNSKNKESKEIRQILQILLHYELTLF